MSLRKYRSIFSVTSKSAITPSFIGRTAMTPSGVRPSIRLASRPTPLICFVSRSMATTDGSLSTMPSPFTYTRVFAVPKSTPMAFAGNNDPFFRNGKRCCSQPNGAEFVTRETSPDREARG